LQLAANDADTPWFCCLHPNPDLASCLIPEERHDGNSSAAAAASENGDGAHFSYSSMPGFIPAAAAGGGGSGNLEMGSTAAAAADDVDLQQLHESNVAHFAAVFNSLPEFGESPWLQQLAVWLAEQQPLALAGPGVVVPRELVKQAPDYGEKAIMFLLCGIVVVVPFQRFRV
jgi:hypothetical protein